MNLLLLIPLVYYVDGLHQLVISVSQGMYDSAAQGDGEQWLSRLEDLLKSFLPQACPILRDKVTSPTC